jgi:hypothetical protein
MVIGNNLWKLLAQSVFLSALPVAVSQSYAFAIFFLEHEL